MLNEKWFPLRVFFLVVVAITLFFLCSNARGQNPKEKTFPLGKPFAATMVVCEKQADAVKLAKNPKVGKVLFSEGKCAVIQAVAVYNKAVHRGKFNVYEVDVGGIIIYSITDWRAETI